jgi:hypothetical protein
MGSVKDNGYFDADSVKDVLTGAAKKGAPSLVDQLKSETPAQRALMLELDSALDAGRPQVADAQSAYDQASAAAKAAQKNADAAIAAAGQHTTYGPYASSTAATSAKNAALDAPSGPGGLSANALQAKAAQLQDAADAAKAKLDALEQVYGHTDAGAVGLLHVAERGGRTDARRQHAAGHPGRRQAAGFEGRPGRGAEGT